MPGEPEQERPQRSPKPPGSMREAGIINRYLKAVESQHDLRAGAASIQTQIDRISDRLAHNTLTGVQRLDLVVRHQVLVQQLSAYDAELEEEFVAIAKEWGERRGATYASWRTMGVSPDVLERAGIKESGT